MAELEEQGLTSSGGTSQSSPQISTGLCGSCDKAVISHFDGKHILSEGMMGGGGHGGLIPRARRAGGNALSRTLLPHPHPVTLGARSPRLPLTSPYPTLGLHHSAQQPPGRQADAAHSPPTHSPEPLPSQEPIGRLRGHSRPPRPDISKGLLKGKQESPSLTVLSTPGRAHLPHGLRPISWPPVPKNRGLSLPQVLSATPEEG